MVNPLSLNSITLRIARKSIINCLRKNKVAGKLLLGSATITFTVCYHFIIFNFGNVLKYTRMNTINTAMKSKI